MINNNRQKDNKADKQSWIDVFARTQKLRTTGDESWKKDVPNIKLSRAFIVVLILHVVAVGGILAFELFKPDEAKLSVMTEQAVDEKLDDKNVIDEKKERRISGDLSGTGAFNKYIVQKGDSIRAIAESFKVSRTEILEVNLIDEGHPLVSGRILRIPKPKMSISGDDIVIGDPVDDSDDFVSIEELTVDANNNGDITLESEDASRKRSDENDGFSYLQNQIPKSKMKLFLERFQFLLKLIEFQPKSLRKYQRMRLSLIIRLEERTLSQNTSLNKGHPLWNC